MNAKQATLIRRFSEASNVPEARVKRAFKGYDRIKKHSVLSDMREALRQVRETHDQQ